MISGIIEGAIRAFTKSSTDGKLLPVRKKGEKMSWPAVAAYALRIILPALVTALVIWLSSLLGVSPSDFYELMNG